MAKKILIADDSLYMRNVLKTILSRWPEYEVMEADSGVTAINKYEEEKPDLILLDIIMPEGTAEGIRVLKAIRKAEQDVPVIMISAVGQDIIMKECKRSGASAYIIKPFDPEEVITTIEKYLK